MGDRMRLKLLVDCGLNDRCRGKRDCPCFLCNLCGGWNPPPRWDVASFSFDQQKTKAADWRPWFAWFQVEQAFCRL